MDNYLIVKFPSLPENEKLARMITGSFALFLDPTLQESLDIKTAVSEAVTNSIIHGYGEDYIGEIEMLLMINDSGIEIVIKDNGCGISDIENARKPFFTSKPDLDRSGMGFTIMESFMDEVNIDSKENEGTKITMKKMI